MDNPGSVAITSGDGVEDLFPAVSGDYVLWVRGGGDAPASQVVLQNLVTSDRTYLAPGGTTYNGSAPHDWSKGYDISGNDVVWHAPNCPRR